MAFDFKAVQQKCRQLCAFSSRKFCGFLTDFMGR